MGTAEYFKGYSLKKVLQRVGYYLTADWYSWTVRNIHTPLSLGQEVTMTSREKVNFKWNFFFYQLELNIMLSKNDLTEKTGSKSIRNA